MRCAVHDLAAADDGKCVLCRREEDTTPSGRFGLWVVIAIGTVALVLIGAKLATSAAVKLAAEPTQVREPAPVGSHPVAADERAPPASAAPLFQLTPEPVKPEPSAKPAAGAPSAAEAREPERRKPTATDLRAALSHVQITMYSASWCPHCTRARNWLTHNSIRFSEHDVDRSPAANRENRRLTGGAGGVPTLVIDGAVLRGFSEQHVAQTIARATERRLKEMP